MKKIVLGALLACIICMVLIAGCTQMQTSSAPPAVKEAKIGVVASLTGPASATGKDMWQSAMIAADEINANGGVYVKDLGAKIPIVLVQGDDESTREGGQKAVSRMISNDNVDVLVGGFSSAVTTAHQSIVADNKVPYIITGASSPTITRRTDVDTSYMYHFCPTTDDYGKQTTEFISEVIRPAINEKYGYSADRPLRLAIVYQDSPYGKGVLSAVEATIQREGLPIQLVSNESFKMGETDFRTLLTSVKATRPDAVYAAAFLNEQAPMIIQARRDVGLDTIFLAVECNDDPDYYSSLGQYGAGSVIESHFSPYTVPGGSTAAAATAFKEAYKSRWGGLPGMMGATTYEGVYIAANAIEQAGSLDKARVQDTLGSMSIPEIIETMQGGEISFTEEAHEAQFTLYMEQLYWDDSLQALRPKIVWPAGLKEADFVLPDWYQPGSP
ncbi:branched-chain amino acid transport system substrate-binding protein [Methanolinea mesophila]|uniref:ABC transporter substrate-binding protein n=1 Tax=Methanolinea mesophila TaxID=547055 RepID=UPI001AE1DD54|nr:ABC transporter substrate-binding protein [Methanolinea mesophila]MBP1929198.1 branched-chain amino acid transport system substrate-binding protein [Methanolinea mesophila]